MLELTRPEIKRLPVVDRHSKQFDALPFNVPFFCSDTIRDNLDLFVEMDPGSQLPYDMKVQTPTHIQIVKMSLRVVDEAARLAADYNRAMKII